MIGIELEGALPFSFRPLPIPLKRCLYIREDIMSVGQRIMTISTTEANILNAKEALRKGGSKLPTPWHIEIEKRAK